MDSSQQEENYRVSGGQHVVALTFSGVINVPIDVSAHAQYMLNHQCAAKGQRMYGIYATGCSLGCI